MRLRKLSSDDAIRMLEWMHNPETTEYLNADFDTKTLKDCIQFIEMSNSDERNLHLAVVDDNNGYNGTVSLKNINFIRKNAEFAITIHPDAQGKGIAKSAMKQILKIGLSDLGLDEIYWCVNPENKRAIRFYDKNGYRRTKTVPKDIKSAYELSDKYIWYVYKNKKLV